jgi:hypothetical protein
MAKNLEFILVSIAFLARATVQRRTGVLLVRKTYDDDTFLTSNLWECMMIASCIKGFLGNSTARDKGHFRCYKNNVYSHLVPKTGINRRRELEE